jgi:phage tail protein X
MKMKSRRLILSVVLMSLSTAVLAHSQSEGQKLVIKPARSEAQESFDKLKTLAGTWQGPITVDPPQEDVKNGTLGQITMRVTSRGNALVHEMQEAGTPLDATRYDHPVTMFYLDGDRLTLIHYCDAGNRPRMTGKLLPNGKTVEFDFVDLSGGNEYGHMYHAVFTIIDANHHIEDWTYMMPGDKPVHAHMDLLKTN